uniref:protein strawberry notch homolog 2 isoform X2 n=1 Tax=Myxine glutinosa TaxID=7769 RepID=UPI00358FF1F1
MGQRQSANGPSVHPSIHTNIHSPKTKRLLCTTYCRMRGGALCVAAHSSQSLGMNASLYKPHYQFEHSSSMLTNGSIEHSHFGVTVEDTCDDISTNQNGDLLNGHLTDGDISPENMKADGHVMYNCFVTHDNGLGFMSREDNRCMDSTNLYGEHSTTGEAAYPGQDGTCLNTCLKNSCHPLPHENHLPLPENQNRNFHSPMQNQSMNHLCQSHEHQEMGPYAAVTNFTYPQPSDHVLDPSEFENIPEDIFDLIEDYLPKDCLITSQPCLESVQINDFQATVQTRPISSSLVGFGPQQPAEFPLLPAPLAVPSIQAEPSERDESEEESEDLVQAETYTDYKPAKVHQGGLHPDSVVETSTLASVAPPDPTYEPALPSETALSGLQLEAVIYACQRHEVVLPGGERGGFLIGDGAGVGKGRTAAAIIFENFLRGRRKALWLSVSNDLLYDAERDLRDVGAAHIPIFSLSKFRYTERPQAEGVLFLTYAALIGESQQGTASVLGNTQAIIPPRTRLEQLLQWCGLYFDGVLVLDECHKAKNLRPTGSARPSKTGCAVLKLQEKLPGARVLYASATGASEPKNMAYMTRLGLWGPGMAFGNFDAFLQSIERRGVPGMELVAVEMKQAGAYLARQLSFRGASFNVEEAILKPAARRAYNEAARLWRDVAAMFEHAATAVGDAVAPNTGGWKTKRFSRKALWGQFWSAHQRFFRYLCVAAKIDRVVHLAQQALMEGKCVVVGLQATGEARTREELLFNHGQLGTFVSSARGVLKSLIEKHFPVGNNWEQPGLRKRKKHPPWRLKAGRFGDGIALESEESGSPSSTCLGLDDDDDDNDVIVIGSTPGPIIADVSRERLESMRAELLQRVDELDLPLNTLDELVDQLGGPQNVAEMTGRRGRVVRRPDGSVHYESRAEPGVSVETVNLTQKEYFMSGQKLVAIISEAASSGISLQADRRVSNHRRRLHLTLELPWSADRAVQQFGRTHRSNQVCAPEYIYLISELAGERRFASAVARRLECLGALTHGDRRASESRDLSQFHYDNKYGRDALEKVIRSIIIGSYYTVRPPNYPGNFFQDMKEGLLGVGIITKDARGNLTVEKELGLSKFLNRLLGLEVERQAALFTYFCSTFEMIMKAAKNAGNYDMGILDIASGMQEIYNEKQEAFPGPIGVELILHTITLDRGITWEDALRRYEKLDGDLEGFYFSRLVRANRKMAVLVVKGDNLETDENEHDEGDCLYEIYRPNTGHQKQQETQNSLRRKFYKVEHTQAEDAWIQQHAWSLHNCSHTFGSGHCQQAIKNCRYGLRLRHYNVLSGGLLSVWPRIEAVLQQTTSSTAMHIVRLATRSGRKHVGIKIPDSCMNPVREILLSLQSYQDPTGSAHHTSCHLITEPLYF